MAHNDERTWDAGGLKCQIKVSRDARSVTWQGARITGAIPCAVIGADPREARQGWLYLVPGPGVSAETRLKQYRRTSPSGAPQV